MKTRINNLAITFGLFGVITISAFTLSGNGSSQDKRSNLLAQNSTGSGTSGAGTQTPNGTNTTNPGITPTQSPGTNSGTGTGSTKSYGTSGTNQNTGSGSMQPKTHNGTMTHPRSDSSKAKSASPMHRDSTQQK